MKTTLAILVLFAELCTAAPALGVFGADTGHQNHPVPGMPPFRIAYGERARFFGVHDPLAVDAAIGGTNFQVIYLWINQTTTEIGVRVLSPVVAAWQPDRIEKGVVRDSNFNLGTTWFNPMVRLEKASVGEPRYLTDDRVKAAKWTELGQNDDDLELPPQPDGNRTQAQVRALQPDNKGLSRGLYRILIRASSDPTVTGSPAPGTNRPAAATNAVSGPQGSAGSATFMVEVGTLGKATALVLGRTVAEVARKAFEVDRAKPQ